MNAGLSVRDVPVGEYTLHLNESGDPAGPPVLWLHGSGPGVGALSNWERLITQLLPGFRNLAPDLLGFGQSSHPEQPPRGTKAFGELRTDTLLRLLDGLGLEKVHVVGNSMGGMIALRMAQKAPDRVGRMALMGSGGAPLPPTDGLIKMVMFYADPTAENMRDIMSSFLCDTTAFAGDLDAIAADRVTKAMRPEVRRSHEATFDRAAGAPMVFSPRELAALPHEVLVLHGREDRIIPIEGSYYLNAHLPNSQLHVLPHAGHWMQLEQAERFAALAELFLGEKL